MLDAYREDVRRERSQDRNRTADDPRAWFDSLQDNRAVSTVTESGRRDRKENHDMDASRRIREGSFQTLPVAIGRSASAGGKRPRIHGASRRKCHSNGHGFPNASSEADWKASLPASEYRPERVLEREAEFLQGYRLYRVPIRWRQYGKPFAVDRIIRRPVKRVKESTETRTSRYWCGGIASATRPHQGRFSCQEQKRSCPQGRLFFWPCFFLAVSCPGDARQRPIVGTIGSGGRRDQIGQRLPFRKGEHVGMVEFILR